MEDVRQIDVHSSTHYKQQSCSCRAAHSSSDADCVCCSSCSRQTSLKSCKQQDFQFYKLSLFWEKTLISLSPLKTLVSLPVRFDLFYKGGGTLILFKFMKRGFIWKQWWSEKSQLGWWNLIPFVSVFWSKSRHTVRMKQNWDVRMYGQQQDTVGWSAGAWLD